MVSLSSTSQSGLQPKREKTSIGSANDTADINHQAIASELEWLSAFIQFRLGAYFEQGPETDAVTANEFDDLMHMCIHPV